LLPRYRRQAFVAVGAAVLLMTLACLGVWEAVLHPSQIPSAATLAEHGPSATVVVFLVWLLGVGLVVWPLLRTGRQPASLTASGLVERIAAGTLQQDAIYEYASPRAVNFLPGRAPEDYRGQAERLCRWLNWYLLPPAPVQTSPELGWIVGLILLPAAVAAIRYWSPLHGLMFLALGLFNLCNNPLRWYGNCRQLLTYLGPAAADPRPAAVPGEASTPPRLPSPADVERRSRLRLELNAVSEAIAEMSLRGCDALWLGCATLPLIPTYRHFSPWVLVPWPVLGIGALILFRHRQARGRAVRAALESSGLAEQLAADVLSLDALQASTVPWARWLLTPPLKGVSGGLKELLATVALNVDWFLRPRPNYVPTLGWLLLSLLLGAALAFGGPGLALTVIPRQVFRDSVAHPAWHDLLDLLIMLVPMMAGMAGVSLVASTIGGDAAVAAEEFLAYLRERVSG
jgi:hypothetical protein